MEHGQTGGRCDINLTDPPPIHSSGISLALQGVLVNTRST